MYNKIIDLVTSLMVENLCNCIIATVVAQPTWATYLTCVILMIIIKISIDTLTLQRPGMNACRHTHS